MSDAQAHQTLYSLALLYVIESKRVFMSSGSSTSTVIGCDEASASRPNAR